MKRRIKYTGPHDEIGKLIEQSNHMFERLEKVYEDLEETYQMQKRFVSDASHELRTPLTSISGNIEYLKKIYQSHPEQIKEIIEEVDNEIDRMTRLMNSLLSLARADAGLRLKSDVRDLLPIFESLIQQTNKIHPSRPLQVNQLSELVNLKIYGNEDYLRQLFVILIENAYKYSEKEVLLTFERKMGQDGKNSSIQISIADHGIGIPEKELPNIFKRFYRAENTHEIKGTGLGLPIAKWIVDQHRGHIEMMSKEGEGTTAVIQLPLF